MNRLLLAALAALALAACKEEVAGRPLPVAMTAESVGHYCQMNLLEHPGPKAQVHLEGLPDPLFFSQVRDAIAYQRMPEQSHAIAAVYVSDMSAAPSWDDPGAENWAPAEDVVYVVGARVPGGMGAPELVPFTTRAGAEAFAATNGGEILPLDAIPDEVVLAPVEFAVDADGNFIPPDGAVAD
jgi:copper chaperone NosL